MNRANSRIWRHFDILLLAAVILLTIAGVAMIRSAIGRNLNLAELVSRQAIYGLIGLVVVIVLAAIDYRFWSALARPIYIFTVVLLAFIFLAGQIGFGAARWFNVGIATIQPSELSKMLLILVVADFLARNRDSIDRIPTLLRSAMIVGFPTLLIVLQPDLSTGIVVIVTWLAMLWAAGLRMKHVGIAILIVVVLLIIATPFMAGYFINGYPQGEDFGFLQYYQMQRVADFLFPTQDNALGSTYNVEQALISIGSGSWLGQGYGHGTQVQLLFLKVRHTDFIFSAMSEEFGFVGSFIMIFTLMFIIYRCFRAASIARDLFGALICYGVAFLLFFQGAFNIGMNLNLFPVSGLPLPFFSYGGSSLVTSLFGIGLVESVMLRHKKIEL
jgi:rod shape determining protein RodA